MSFKYVDMICDKCNYFEEIVPIDRNISFGEYINCPKCNNKSFRIEIKSTFSNMSSIINGYNYHNGYSDPANPWKGQEIKHQKYFNGTTFKK